MWDERKSARFTMSLPRWLYEAMEDARGDVPRSIYIQRLLERDLGVPAANRAVTAPALVNGVEEMRDIRLPQGMSRELDRLKGVR